MYYKNMSKYELERDQILHRLYIEYIKKYGFGDYTNIDLQGETQGQLKPLDSWYPIDAATMPFGQGISVTALQLVRGFAAVINGGYLMRPYIVKEVIEEAYVSKRDALAREKYLKSGYGHEQLENILKNTLSGLR